MDATRLFRFTVYCPMTWDGYIDEDTQLSLEDAYYHFLETGCSLFMACDALSLEHKSCVLDFTDLTHNETVDLHIALNGR